ncbi:hypothetical protein OIDMADRAFT_54255 [Oidiodendron maius Zn]|uniref:MARVEL domain-containing protein n=1 Tax=Oidiodendron maius (strain Zn) TaxID=913774 RepID=A0A0C3CQ11_OIDMZ|nr:hypothetical protein OIDMADRAFT_54255 [Oidiodendron maius Zn]
MVDLTPFVLPVRVVQFIFSIVVIGTEGYVANRFDNYFLGTAPAEVAFLIFCAVWTWLVLAYVIGAPLVFPVAAHHYAVAAVEIVTMIFWFAGFIALAANLGWCPSGYHITTCSAADAGTAFAAFEWVLFVFTSVVAVIAALGNRSSVKAEAAPPVEAMHVP